MEENSSPRAAQWSAMPGMSSVRSWKVNPSNAVWVERTVVGRTAHSMPAAEMMGRASVREHLPTPEMSWMVSTRFMMLLLFI